jgi:hypothetical protein
VDSSSSVKAPMASYFGHDNEHTGFINDDDFAGHSRDRSSDEGIGSTEPAR